jgi:hypothetical protein
MILVLLDKITHLIVVGSGARFKWYTFDSSPFGAAKFSAIITTEIAGSIPSHVYNHRIMILISCSSIIEFRIDIVVPVAFRSAAVPLGLHTIATILMRLAMPYTGSDVYHNTAVENFNYALRIQIAQHVGISSTTGFYITTRIDM